PSIPNRHPTTPSHRRRSSKGPCLNAGPRTSRGAENWQSGRRDRGPLPDQDPGREHREGLQQTPLRSCHFGNAYAIGWAQSFALEPPNSKPRSANGNPHADGTTAKSRGPSHEQAAVNTRYTARSKTDARQDGARVEAAKDRKVTAC